MASTRDFRSFGSDVPLPNLIIPISRSLQRNANEELELELSQDRRQAFKCNLRTIRDGHLTIDL